MCHQGLCVHHGLSFQLVPLYIIFEYLYQPISIFFINLWVAEVGNTADTPRISWFITPLKEL